MDSPETPDTPRHHWRVGYASGAFDQLHVGHLRYLLAAAAQCERLAAQCERLGRVGG
jgi:bifunctional ADP-heptose synthase (sugar kinase/adenylyltransferase)